MYAGWPQWYRQGDFRALIDASDAANFNELTGQSGFAPIKTTDAAVLFNGQATTRVTVPENLTDNRWVDIGRTNQINVGANWNGGIMTAVRFSAAARARLVGSGVEVRHYIGDSNYTNFWQKAWLPLNFGYVLNDEWQYFTTMLDDWAATGSPVVANFVRSKLRIYFPVGAECEFWVGQVAVPPRTRSQIIISFDDGASSVYTSAWPQAAARGIKTSYGITREFIGESFSASLAQLREMNASPYAELINHSTTGESITTDLGGDAERLVANAVEMRSWMAQQGLGTPASRNVFVIPRGEHNSAFVDLIRSAGFSCARAAHKNNTTWSPTYGQANPRLFSVPLTIELGSAMTLEQAKAKLDMAIARSTTCIVMGHKLGAVADALTWTVSDYMDLLDYLVLKRQAGLVDDMFFSEWVLGMTQPQLAAA